MTLGSIAIEADLDRRIKLFDKPDRIQPMLMYVLYRPPAVVVKRGRVMRLQLLTELQTLLEHEAA